jgi:uncharacterized Ntn-hydrolase superfamily protein
MDARKLASTFSIVAFDPQTGAIGAAVQSRSFAIGSLCLWAGAATGAVVTQSFLNVSFGPVGLEFLSRGETPVQVIERFKHRDDRMEFRQVALVDRKGDVVTFTGRQCIPEALGRSGKHFAVQGNVLPAAEVVDRMAEGYESAAGSFPRRLLAALTAGQQAGGDTRGSRSAAMIVEQEDRGRMDYGSRSIDLRVEDHPDPNAELTRLVEISELQSELGCALLDASNNPRSALERAQQIAARFPAHGEEAWLNIAAAQDAAGMRSDARESLRRALDLEPRLVAIIDHYPNLRLLALGLARRRNSE